MFSISTKSHLKNLALPTLFFLVLFSVLRLFLFFWSGGSTDILEVLATFMIGLLFDFSTLLYIMTPFFLLIIFIPPRKNSNLLSKRYNRILTGLFALISMIIIFSCFSEITFWAEFHSRFNFIAVDYLIYTNEVLKNIWESYHIGFILFGILISAVTVSFYFNKKITPQTTAGFLLHQRSGLLAIWILLLAMNYFLFPANVSEKISNYSLQEVSKNGIHTLFAAYFENSLDYNRFYKTINQDDAFKNIRLQYEADNIHLNKSANSIGRIISSEINFKNYNVILVTMESLSARYMQAYGNNINITPNLDQLAKEGLFFSNIFSTGTRTVRGLEALSLSVPPTPGQSIVRRPKNENLYNIGNYLNHAGYVTDFLYGGHGYFDNMNEFFSSNGFNIWDRSTLKETEITFTNAWGVCDEDLYNMSIRQADTAFKEKKPFFQFIMTTSNHRPYTYPQKIDIPSGSGRDGAVKYSDFAIGEFIKNAKTKPWFKSTIFIFIADHNASVSGNTAIPIRDYRIPFIIYAPDIVKPQKVEKLGSQIDFAPTLLGLMHAKYNSHFFGHDLMTTTEERAFLGNYQTVGLLKENILTLLSPNKKVEQFKIDKDDNQELMIDLNLNLVEETISYYQTASFLFTSAGMVDTGDDKILNLK